jgi:hypothetical protein
MGRNRKQLWRRFGTIASEHAAGDHACGRSWQCACVACLACRAQLQTTGVRYVVNGIPTFHWEIVDTLENGVVESIEKHSDDGNRAEAELVALRLNLAGA